jgi:hypothetical protein
MSQTLMGELGSHRKTVQAGDCQRKDFVNNPPGATGMRSKL